MALEWPIKQPAPPKTALSDKSAEYVETYEQAYESEAKKIRRTGAWRGTAGAVLVGTVSLLYLWALLQLGR